MSKIGFVGNFIPPFSTENERKWSFEKLGHEVIPFQENETTSDQLIEAADDLDLLLYSHTHDPAYVIKGLREVFAYYKDEGIPTASAHLDRWIGLDREKDMGQEATWDCEYVFMADCSPEATKKYDELGLNWHHLKPGVVERECYMGEPDRDKFPHDIIFVGSKGYHPEHPARPQLIEWLAKIYGDRFGHYGNDGIRVVRGDELNTLYASAKVVVGDSCFGGRSNYVSDRYYETPGRGGLLIHPWVDAQTTENPGVVHFEKDNTVELMEKIDWFLSDEDANQRMRKRGFEWVKENGTYTHRSEQMLKIMELT